MNPFQEGKVLLINKDLEWSSFAVVKKIKYLTKAKKVGHAGTLDPLATGLLIICTGPKTKEISLYQGLTKEYTGRMVLGAVTASYDAESEATDQKPFEHITEESVLQALQTFTGTILQMPPAFSAKKINGKRAYDIARAGETPDLKAVEVNVSEYSISSFKLPYIEFKVVCSKGTYIRSLVHDLGQALGCGAYMDRLCRTAIGEHRIENALTIAEFEESLKSNKVSDQSA